ncbi:MAG TPA: hydrogenase maturation protease [Terriglobales bacterium]|nr:hydrogenase maturation protease [Terriglobales bacterium]
MGARILVACVGNIFLGDDGFGVEVAHRLAQRSLPDGVRVVDFGIRSYDLAYAIMEDWDLVILVDAVSRGGKPGTIYTIEPELPAAGTVPGGVTFDAHAMNPASVLQLVGALGGRCRRMLVVGCEPTTFDPGDDGQIGVSAPVGAAIDEAVAVIERLTSGAANAMAA